MYILDVDATCALHVVNARKHNHNVLMNVDEGINLN